MLQPSAPALGAAGDALVQLMVALKAASDASLANSVLNIQNARGDLKQELEEFLKKVREAAQQLRETKDDGGGLFGDVFDAIGDALGDLVGTIADACVDLVKSPYEISKAVVTNFGDTQAMLQALRNASLDLVRNGAVASDVKGFTQGVVSFCGALSEYLARYPLDAGLAALRGENPLAALKADAKALWQSFKHNVLENPAFWAVASVLAKGMAVAGAAATGGVLAIVAVGLLVALEVDRGTGAIEKVLGEKAAPWVRLGMELGAAGCLGVVAMGSQASGVLQSLQSGTALLQSGAAVYGGYTTIKQAQLAAEHVEQQAHILQSMNRMQQLQRLLDRLLASLEADSTCARKIEERGVQLVNTASATEAALIVPA